MKNKFKIYIKNFLSWLFRDTLMLDNKWWHRLIKVIFLLAFFSVVIIVYTEGLYSPSEKFLRAHNIKIHNSLYEFTENYSDHGYENTIPKFFEQSGHFGVLVDNRIRYISWYSFEESLCVKNPEEHLDSIAIALYPNYFNSLSYEAKKNSSFGDFKQETHKFFYEDTTRKCWLFGFNIYDENKEKVVHLSEKTINYSLNLFFYLEFTLLMLLVSLLSFFIFALIYYRGILYVVYGNKK